jgi:hypothetical protein
LNSIFARLCQRKEPIVLRAGVLLEAGAVVWKTVRIGHLRQEILLRKPAKNLMRTQESGFPSFPLRNLQFPVASNRNVVQVLHTALDSDGFTHLHHRGSFFGFQKLYPRHIS